MPDNSKQPTRVIKGSTPTSNYAASTKPLVQGKSSNKTAQYLADILPNDPGQQGFYREALTGIPHPLQAGKTLSYGGLQDLLAGPQGAAAREAYGQANRMQRAPSIGQYEQAAYTAAHAQMVARGAANPGELAFPASADAARRAPNTAMAIAHGNFVAPEGGAVVDAASLAQRADDVAGSTPIMAAPGMAVRLVRGAAPATRVIPGSIVSR